MAHLLAVVALVSGCANLGPKAVEAGRADYNAVLRDTTDQQLLANLVRLRYRDRPYFLEVSAVTTQYSFAPQLSAIASVGPRDIEQDALISGGIMYEERPTITYSPLQGEDFTRRLLTPISIEALVLLSNSGWSAERLLRICVQHINGVPNAVTASGPTPDTSPVYESFHRLARLFRQLQVSDDIAIGFQGGEMRNPVVSFSERAMTGSAYREIVDLLGLTPGESQYEVVSALRQIDSERISVQPRSLNGVLYYLSHSVSVPAPHRDAGLVTTTRDRNGELFNWSELTDGLMRIEVDLEPPQNAAVEVSYRGHWYYIADNDLTSKSTFSLLAQLFALQSGKGEELRPVLTLPLGG